MSNIEELFNALFTSIENIEPLLTILRNEGVSQIDTVKLIMNRTKLPLKEVDAIVLNSETWKDVREANISLRDTFFDQFN